MKRTRLHGGSKTSSGKWLSGFGSAQARRAAPGIHYKASPREAAIGRWLNEQLEALERYPCAVNGKRLSGAEHELLLRADFKLNPKKERQP